MDQHEQATSHDAGETCDERGSGLVEYALLVALIALVCFSALQVFGVANGGSINNTADSVADATS